MYFLLAATGFLKPGSKGTFITCIIIMHCSLWLLSSSQHLIISHSLLRDLSRNQWVFHPSLFLTAVIQLDFITSSSSGVCTGFSTYLVLLIILLARESLPQYWNASLTHANINAISVLALWIQDRCQNFVAPGASWSVVQTTWFYSVCNVSHVYVLSLCV